MKLRAVIFLVGMSCWLAIPANLFPLTNAVVLPGQGMRLLLSDEWPKPMDEMARDLEMDADGSLVWAMENLTANKFNAALFLGMSNSFAFDATTTNGIRVPRTARGDAMNVGPRSTTDLNLNRRKWIGEGVMDFPRLNELFEFPSPGIYILELRFWNWSMVEKEFRLSPPIRVRVIKRLGDTVPKPANAGGQEATTPANHSFARQIFVPTISSTATVTFSNSPMAIRGGASAVGENHWSAAQKVGGSVLASLLALSFALVWRASRRKKD